LSFRASGHGLILLGDVLDAFFGSHGFDFLPPPTDAVTIWPNLVVVPKHEGTPANIASVVTVIATTSLIISSLVACICLTGRVNPTAFEFVDPGLSELNAREAILTFPNARTCD